jgi:hypothetical protein
MFWEESFPVHERFINLSAWCFTIWSFQVPYFKVSIPEGKQVASKTRFDGEGAIKATADGNEDEP